MSKKLIFSLKYFFLMEFKENLGKMHFKAGNVDY